MPLTIYEVVSGGTKQNHPPGGEDWCVVVAATSPTEARDIAWRETQIGRPWAIYEWGVHTGATIEPGVLRGPYEHCPALNRGGWTMYREDLEDRSESPAVVLCPSEEA